MEESVPKFAFEFERPVVELEAHLEELKKSPLASKTDIALDIKYFERELEKLKLKVYSDLSPWEKVLLARHPERPRTLDYIRLIFSDFTELHGDRNFRDDPAIVGGLCYIDHQKIVVLGHQKGKNAKDNIARNFGMPHPEGYHKALRLMKLAEKFDLPVISFIDTPGAFPGVAAEERGQALAIAKNIMEMSQVNTPIIVVLIGEGGSGGALALGVGDKVFMLENAYYSVISPEGCASILWKDGSKAPEAAEVLKLTAENLLEYGIIDGIIDEPLGGAHRDIDLVAYKLRNTLLGALKELKNIPLETVLQSRYQRFRKIGAFQEKP